MADLALLRQWANGEGAEEAIPLPTESRLHEVAMRDQHDGLSRLPHVELAHGLPAFIPSEDIVLP